MSYIILDNNSVWGRYKRILNSNGIPVLGKTETTIGALASEIVFFNASAESARTGSFADIRSISSKGAVIVLRSVAMSLGEAGKLEYYKQKVLDDIATCNEIYRVVNLLRMEEIKSDAAFTSRPGLKDLKLIWTSFEKELEDKNLYDSPRMIIEAVNLLKNDAFRSDYLSSLETDVIECFHEEDLSFMEKEMERLLNVRGITTDITSELKSKRGASNLHFYKAYGRENEIRKIVDTIKNEGIPFGDINIFMSSQLYEGYIQAVLGREGISCSFVTGRSPVDSYYRLMNDILEFAKNGFYYADYRRICRNSLFSNVCYGMNLQNDSNIGWGKELYILRADTRIDEINKTIDEIENDTELTDEEKNNRKVYQNRKIQYYEMMRDLALIFENKTTLSKLYNSLVAFLNDYSNAKNPQRKNSLADLKNLCGEISDISERTGVINLDRALLFFCDYISNISVTDSERSDSVSVIRMGSHYFSDRKHNFFVGLSFGDFSVTTTDSPVMSDKEMLQIFNSEDVLAGNKNKKKEKATRYTIDNAAGEVYLSYTYYDTSRLVDMTPHDIYVDYCQPEEEEDVKFISIGTGALKFKMEDYKVFADSEQDEKESDNDEDGIEAPDEAIIDPLSDENTVSDDQDGDDISEDITEVPNSDEICMSATGRIKTLLNCKREHAYKYIYRLHEEEELKITDREWLSAAEKGLLAHEVLEKYLGEVQIPGGDGEIEDSFNEAVYLKIYNEACEQYRRSNPVRPDEVVNSCIKKYKDGLADYLKSVHAEFASDGWKIAGLEAQHILKNLLSDAIIAINPEAVIPQINADARIDRVDKKTVDGQTVYRIVDYKSGSHSLLIEGVENRLIIQHELYMMVLEKLIEQGNIPSGTVQGFEYHFIYEENPENKVFKREPDADLRKYFLEEILDSFTGQLSSFPDEDNCKFCKYKDICKE